MERSIEFRLNGRATRLHTDDQRKLLWVLRGDLGLTGTKYGCGEGLCGACTVLVGDDAAYACRTKVGAIEGKEVLTVEGLAREGALHPLQQAFVERGALQCGYCTPGMLMSALALLRANPDPTREAIASQMEANLCRCGSQQRLMAAIEDAAKRMRRPA